MRVYPAVPTWREQGVAANFSNWRGVIGKTTGANGQRADIRGAVTVSSRPTLLQNWRIEPNLSGSVSIAETSLNIVGIRLNVGNEVKPLLDKTVSEQIGNLSNQLRSDPRLEQIARREWVKLCRSIALGKASKDAPNLWLEMKPVRAQAASPRIDPNWVILTVGVQAETRIVASETKPACPFPQRLEIVPQMDQGKVSIGVPIDIISGTSASRSAAVPRNAGPASCRSPT